MPPTGPRYPISVEDQASAEHPILVAWILHDGLILHGNPNR
jgi:hypothetical protein